MAKKAAGAERKALAERARCKAEIPGKRNERVAQAPARRHEQRGAKQADVRPVALAIEDGTGSKFDAGARAQEGDTNDTGEWPRSTRR